jgi:hypothetical protein
VTGERVGPEKRRLIWDVRDGAKDALAVDAISARAVKRAVARQARVMLPES